MGYLDRLINYLKEKFRYRFSKTRENLHPKDILAKLIQELEDRKKLGIEEKAFVPNFYAVYLNPFDHEELSPFLGGIKDQLKNRLLERVQKKGYRLLSQSISLDIREDRALERSQTVVESGFVKEKGSSTPPVLQTMDEKTQIIKPRERTGSFDRIPPFSPSPKQGANTLLDIKEKGQAPEPKGTILVEDKKTRYIDNTKLKLEIVEGEKKGEVIHLREGEYTFGRGKDAQFLIKDPAETVSRNHFKVRVKEGRATIKDLQSTNGTKVNQIEIEEAELHKGDLIQAGKMALKVA